MRNPEEGRYELAVAVTERDHERYSQLERKMDLILDDEDESLRRIVEQEPDYLVHNFPFLGYVQLLYEPWTLPANEWIARMDVHIGWVISGMESRPHDDTRAQHWDRPWLYTAEPTDVLANAMGSKPWSEPTALVEAMKLAWRQVRAIDDPLLAGAAEIEPVVTSDEKTFTRTAVSLERNVVWRTKAATPEAEKAGEPWVWISASVYRPSDDSQPSANGRMLRTNAQRYALELTVDSSNWALAAKVEGIFLDAFKAFVVGSNAEQTPGEAR